MPVGKSGEDELLPPTAPFTPMARFRSTYEHNIDSKGRLAIPAKMRAAGNLGPGSQLIAASQLDDCVMLYLVEDWERREDDLKNLNLYLGDVRDAARFILPSAEEVELDAQARIVLPKGHLDYATLSASAPALVLGVGDHIEIWNPDVYRARMNNRSTTSEGLLERVMTHHQSPPTPLPVHLSYGQSAS